MVGLAFLLSILFLVSLVALLMFNEKSPGSGGKAKAAPLVVFCAAGIKPPIEAIAAEYQQAYGITVQLQYGGSQTLLAGIEVARRGDLYLPADETYVAAARAKGLVAEALPLAKMTAVLAVRKGNPKNIRRLADLMRSDIAVAQATPEAAAIGQAVRAALEKSGQWEALRQKTRVFKPTVNDVANDLKLGTVDAGFI